jgi:flagellar basal-body rod protein FlgC
MTPAFQAAKSGLFAQALRLQVSAHNVANMNTDGFKSQRVDLSEGPSGQVLPFVRTEGNLGRPDTVLGLDGSPLQPSDVDFAEEAILQLTAIRAYEANLIVIREESSRLKEVLRTVA